MAKKRGLMERAMPLGTAWNEQLSVGLSVGLCLSFDLCRKHFIQKSSRCSVELGEVGEYENGLKSSPQKQRVSLRKQALTVNKWSFLEDLAEMHRIFCATGEVFSEGFMQYFGTLDT